MHRNQCSVWKQITLGQGTILDYQRLAAYHYRGGRPVGVTRVFIARYACETVGVLVETRPVLNCLLRGMALGGRYDGRDREVLAVLLNREVRTLARVIVEPRFRGIGLGVALVRHALAHAQTRYVEALAVMGHVQPFFEKAGMRGFERPMGAQAVRLLAAIEADATKHEVAKTTKTHEENKKETTGRQDARTTSGRQDACGTTGMELLLGLREADVSKFLAGELRRFARRKTGGISAWLAEARQRVGCVPRYYLWIARRGNARPTGAKM